MSTADLGPVEARPATPERDALLSVTRRVYAALDTHQARMAALIQDTEAGLRAERTAEPAGRRAQDEVSHGNC